MVALPGKVGQIVKQVFVAETRLYEGLRVLTLSRLVPSRDAGESIT